MNNNFLRNIHKFFDFSKSPQLGLTLFSEIVLGIFAVVGSLFIFLKLADSVIEKDVISFDDKITHFIYLFRAPTLTTIANVITFFGSPEFLGVAIIVTIILLFRKHSKDAFVFGFILFFGLGLNVLLKDMFHRPRPTLLPLVHENSYSFPSGHSMNSFVFYISLTYFIFRNNRNKKQGVLLSVLSGILVFAIGMSRIYLGAHFPSDVIAGFAAGLLWFVVVLLFEKTLVFLKLFHEYELRKKY